MQPSTQALTKPTPAETQQRTAMVQKWTKEANALVAELSTFDVTDEITSLAAQDQLKEIAGRIKDIEEIKEYFYAPIRDSIERHRAFFGTSLKAWTEADQILRGKVNAYNAEQSRKRQAALAEAQAAAKAGAPMTEVRAAVMASAQRPQRVAGVSTQKVYRHKVIDPAKVPDEWWVLNESALAAFAKATKGGGTIPGVEFYTEEITKVRA